MSIEVENVKSFLRSRHMHICDQWAEQFVAWFKSESTSSYTQNVMNETVYEQWLQMNLRDMEIGSLPENITSYKKIELPGKYALQIEYIKDSSQSAYMQLQELRKVSRVNIEATIEKEDYSKPKSNRVISLHMCDGLQNVIGMEYKPISKINTNIKPGTKVVIIGPVECRNGVILLQDHNINILGGEIEDLLVKNAYENVLLRTLGLPEINNPKTENHEINDIETLFEDDADFDFDQIDAVTQQSTLNLQHKNKCKENVINDNIGFLNQNENILDTKQTYSNRIDQNDYTTNKNTDNIFLPNENEHEADLFSFDEELEILEREMENINEQKTIPLVKNNNLSNKINNPIDKSEQVSVHNVNKKNTLRQSTLNFFMNNEKQLGDPCLSNSKNEDTIDSLKRKREQSSDLDDLYLSDDIFDTEIDKIESDINLVSKKQPIVVPPEPWIYIDQILKERNDLKPGSYTIKAKVKNLVKKLEFLNKQWSLKCILTDGTGELTVDIANKILEEIIGYTSEQVILTKKLTKTNHFHKDQLLQALLKAKDKILSLNCLLEIEIQDSVTDPIITNYKNVSESHLFALKNRLNYLEDT